MKQEILMYSEQEAENFLQLFRDGHIIYHLAPTDSMQQSPHWLACAPHRHEDGVIRVFGESVFEAITNLPSSSLRYCLDKHHNNACSDNTMLHLDSLVIEAA